MPVFVPGVNYDFEIYGCLQCGQHEEMMLKFMELYKHVCFVMQNHR